MPGVTLDAGVLIALDRNDRRVVILLARAHETGARISVPATALGQAVQRPDRQVRLARLVRQPATDVVDLGRVDATNVGRLLAASGTPISPMPMWSFARAAQGSKLLPRIPVISGYLTRPSD
jgi:hypothetical protein